MADRDRRLRLAGVVYTDADEVRNRVRIGIADRSLTGAINRELARLGIPRAETVEKVGRDHGLDEGHSQWRLQARW